ncbi:MAG: TRAP transporter substrate-binding protein DctP [Firmicutes bacterium]|jgi:tripartite ATP-independent transporter DctP family solute receptor|nr:TRAP transporter substrate-binding protein DctP [Bacillota bacterium]
MKQMKKLLAVLLVFVMVFSMAACGDKDNAGDGQGDASGEPVTLHMGGGLTQQSPQYAVLQQFKKDVEEASGGSITISLDLSGALGSDREIIEGVMSGAIEMMHMADVSINTVITELGYTSLPYLFPSREDAENIYLFGWMGEAYKATMEENGMHVLGDLLEGDFRWLTNSKHAIKTPDDLKNLKIRVIESPMWISFFQGIGTNPVGMSVNEVAAALQQNVIDGQDNGPLNTYFYGFYEFQPYLTKSNHGYAANMLTINKELFESLSAEQQKILEDCGKTATANMYKANVDAIDGFCDEMAAAGTELLDASDELSNFMKEAAIKVWNDESIVGAYDQDIMKRVYDELAVS